MLKPDSGFDGCSNLDKYANISKWSDNCYKRENIEIHQIGLVKADLLVLTLECCQSIGIVSL
ncbi:MAG: hypothetical protein QM204_05940 [Bacillota bacterium]|jgi:hypothetical protein|nr:hypothetical protein [Bacillota bacterium]NLL26994.1 hypothetical protein [Erysipelotrichia bacterium]